MVLWLIVDVEEQTDIPNMDVIKRNDNPNFHE